MRLPPATEPMIQRTRTSTGQWRGPTAGSSRSAPAVCLRSSCRPTTRRRLDSGGNNVYDVIVRATERDSQSPLTGTRTVAVTVTNVDEPPTIDGPANVDYAENRGRCGCQLHSR